MRAQETVVQPVTPLGIELERLRGLLDLSKSAVAEQAGMPLRTWNRLLADPDTTPQWRVVVRAATAVGLPDEEALRLANMAVAPPGTRRVIPAEDLKEFQGVLKAS